MGYKEKHGQGVQKEFAKRGEQQLQTAQNELQGAGETYRGRPERMRN